RQVHRGDVVVGAEVEHQADPRLEPTGTELLVVARGLPRRRRVAVDGQAGLVGVLREVAALRVEVAGRDPGDGGGGRRGLARAAAGAGGRRLRTGAHRRLATP